MNGGSDLSPGRHHVHYLLNERHRKGIPGHYAVVHQLHKGRQGEGQHVSKSGKHREAQQSWARSRAQGNTQKGQSPFTVHGNQQGRWGITLLRVISTLQRICMVSVYHANVCVSEPVHTHSSSQMQIHTQASTFLSLLPRPVFCLYKISRKQWQSAHSGFAVVQRPVGRVLCVYQIPNQRCSKLR